MLKLKPNYENSFFDDYVWKNFVSEKDDLVKIKEFINLEFLAPILEEKYSNENKFGRTPIDPRILFMILLLEFIENLSDVKVVKQLRRVPLYRFFVGLSPLDPIPDDSTLSFFRTQRMGEEKFKTAFDNVVKQLYDEGLIDGKIQSQDATDIRGDIATLTAFQLIDKCRKNILKAVKNINPHKHEKLIKKYNFEIQRNPKNKQEHFQDLIDVTKKLVLAIRRSKKLLKDQKIQYELSIADRVLEEREDEFFDDEGKKQKKEDVDKITGKMINPSDPDVSWGAKSNKKFFAGYKAEVNTDQKYGIVTEIEVTKAGHPEEKVAADLLERQKDNLNIVPENFTADAKYDAGNTRVELKAVGVKNLFIPLIPTKNKTGKFLLDDFSLEHDNLFCPGGYPAEYMHQDDEKLGFEFSFNASVCNNCSLKSECTKSNSGRRVFFSHTQLERRYAIFFNTSDLYQAVYKGQHWKVEPKNADLKKYCGLKRARYRGLSRVKIQAYLSAMVSNFKKYVKFTLGKIKDGIRETLAKITTLPPPIFEGLVCPYTA